MASLGAVAPAYGQGPGQDENHFRCYIVSQQTPQPAATVTLEDQFTDGPETVTVGEPVWFCPPTAKTVGGEEFPIEDEQEHYTFYTAPSEAAPRNVFVTTRSATTRPGGSRPRSTSPFRPPRRSAARPSTTGTI